MRWVSRLLTRITWLHITRMAGLVGLYYELVYDQIDKPSVMVVIGGMILGTEALARVVGSIGPKK